MRSITAICLALVLAGCKSSDTTSTTQASSEPVAADNTEKNARDRTVNALLPSDQGESEADRGITQRARQSVIAADELSMDAKNVKIITQNGVVTLRGPVASEAEKGTVTQLVKAVDGVARVDVQLEVAADESTTAKSNRPKDQR